MRFGPGMKVAHRAHPGWGVGHVTRVFESEGRLEVVFPGRPEGPAFLSDKDRDLDRRRLRPGEAAVLDRGLVVTVDRALPGADDGPYRYAVRDGDRIVERGEEALLVPPPRPGPLDALAEARFGPVEAYRLRDAALRLDLERRADALGALLASRVMVKPHQVAVAQRVLAAREPRFVLADEVGLGKTIEAGLVLAALAHAGLVRRVLVVAPAHLTVQWLAEMFHKFNFLFALLDADRLEAERRSDDGRSPFERYARVIVSLEQLARGGAVLDQVCAPGAAWDLVVVDEAHHLRAEGAFEAARRLARATWGLLLLTATPLRLDPDEYHRLLSLVEPIPSTSIDEFRERMARQADLALLARALVDGGDLATPLARVRDLMERDAAVRPLLDRSDPASRSALLRELAEGYSLSTRLIRNRRAAVGGFERRRLERESVVPSAAAFDLQRRIRARVARAAAFGRLPAGAALATVLRRLDSSPPALAEALRASHDADLAAMAPAAEALAGPTRDVKLQALIDRIARAPSGEKVLVFAEARETVEYLATHLGRAGMTTVVYHGGLSTLDRDRHVARFRDPDGPRVMLSTELGGEGRNFQFCHVVVHYDLAWSPATLEQRIGRVDRIGQRHPVQVVVFRPEGTLAAHVADVLVRAVRVFEETVGGLDAALEQTEGELVKLALRGDDEAAFAGYAESLAARIADARAKVAESYDPLLDLRSFDRDAVRALLRRGVARLGIADAPEGDLEEDLTVLSRELEERLEETAVAIAREVGMDADTDRQVDAFQCAFHLGPGLKVDALPGYDLSTERTVVGTFWRDTAVEQEETDHFTTGHPLVESLFSYVRDGEVGRAAALRLSGTGLRTGRGFAFRFVVQPPEAEDLHPGSNVASRQAMRYLDARRLVEAVEIGRGGRPLARPEWAKALGAADALLAPVAVKDLPAPDAAWAAGVQSAMELAERRAQDDLAAAQAEGREQLAAERARTLRALDRWMRARGATAELSEAERGREEAAFAAIAAAIDGCRLELDAVAYVVIAD